MDFRFKCGIYILLAKILKNSMFQRFAGNSFGFLIQFCVVVVSKDFISNDIFDEVLNN